ncbi:hypothetical protein Mp_4g13530 [Marchantia polymorpha subsp. ruderalis]|uniref:Uncharacterized protein n=2 Tax=Marchantia polymorpha TaxID=3197 RepID=A0AAF6B9J7_MARPO|nr:hypothetical protein MARPO_0138s0051 [Marchantia polymorpha]BBN08681.1 hypothetical protein Mp_4g13530 [Marchantia polymorpha subsp. ruderalis]|eukprot:PTQ29625.1 hypothetical protein MARPO_0138s0051 [Marchantia polymorpha]
MAELWQRNKTGHIVWHRQQTDSLIAGSECTRGVRKATRCRSRALHEDGRTRASIRVKHEGAVHSRQARVGIFTSSQVSHGLEARPQRACPR